MNTKQIKVVGVTDATSFDVLKDVLNCESINNMALLNYEETLDIDRAASLPVDSIVMYTADFNGDDVHFMEEFFKKRKDVAGILLCDNVTMSVMNAALRCGISRVLSTEEFDDAVDIQAEIINETLRFTEKKESAVVREYESKVISFFSAKGGSGKTTLAYNIAAMLKERGKKVAVLDFDLSCGDMTSLFTVAKGETIAELAEENSLTPTVIKGYLRDTKQGVKLLCPPTTPGNKDAIQEDHVKKIIATVRMEYDYTIIDMSPDIDSDVTLAALEESDNIFMIVNPEIPTLQRTRKYIETMDKLPNIELDRMEVIVNKTAQNKAALDIGQISQIINKKPLVEIPLDSVSVTDSLNRGQPLNAIAPRSKVSKAIDEFVTKVIGVSDPNAKRHLF